MRYRVSLVLALALGATGCSESSETGGDAGDGGADLCEGVMCEDDGNACTEDAVCDPGDGMCDYAPVDDGTICEAGACQAGRCEVIASRFPCTEQGIRRAIAVGEGPHAFDCDGPTTVVTGAVIIIDNDVILDGEGNLTVDGNDDHQVFSVPEGVGAVLRGFTIVQGFDFESEAPGWGAVGFGGGIRNDGILVVINSTVSDSVATIGGGVANTGNMTLLGSTVSGNQAFFGGGIANHSGTTTITSSSVSGNWAGCVQNTCDCGPRSECYLSPDGSGITSFGSSLGESKTTVEYSTISANVGRAIAAYGYPTITLKGSLLDGDCHSNAVTSNGYNIESPGDTCGFDQPSDQVNVTADDLKLGELADNGGPTMTHALLPGSVAIDQISEADCVNADGEPLTTDQRGEPRPETGGTMCDVGAFEVQP